MLIPIFLSTARNSEPSRCPNCKNVENTKVVCKHCDYEYQEPETTIGQNVMVVLTTLTVIFIVFTFIIWAVDRSRSYHPTDLSYIEYVWNILKSVWGLIKAIV